MLRIGAVSRQDSPWSGFLHASELISYHLPPLCFNHTDPLLYLYHDKHTHLSYPLSVWFHETFVFAMLCAPVHINVYDSYFLLRVKVSKEYLPRHSPESGCLCWWRIEISMNLCFNVLWSNLSSIYIATYQKQKWKKHKLSVSTPEKWDGNQLGCLDYRAQHISLWGL